MGALLVLSGDDRQGRALWEESIRIKNMKGKVWDKVENDRI